MLVKARHRSAGRRSAGAVLAAASVRGVMAIATDARAERIENQTAVFAALDKVTARISPLNAPLNATEPFGALKVTARACYSRGPTEAPKTTAFVEVDEVLLDGSSRRIFSGWMFAESPGLNAIEHPVFDLWLTECANPVRSAASQRGAPAGQAGQGESEPAPRRRVRR
jgi:hypothetical protein